VILCAIDPGPLSARVLSAVLKTGRAFVLAVPGC